MQQKVSSILEKRVRLALALALLVNVAFWFVQRDMRAQWGNVPPAPKEQFSASYGLGDKSFAYRMNSIMLQNLGDAGGRVTSLNDYDYDELTNWFFLQDKLDSVSEYIPRLASYLFGGVQDSRKFRPVLDYLRAVGERSEGTKWNWLVFAVFFARHELEDMDKALELANVLAKNESETAPAWIKQMPAYVLNAKGSKREAYSLLVETLKANMNNMSNEEINATRAFICERILGAEEASSDPLCQEPY